MLDREPFLKAIFAEPGNDLPRLVFADWLDDHDDPEWAEFIRLQCEHARLWDEPGADVSPHYRRLLELFGRLRERPSLGERWGSYPCYHRGFRRDEQTLAVTAERLLDADEFRRVAVAVRPDWFGQGTASLRSGMIRVPEQVATLLTSPVTERVTALRLDGGEEQLGTAHDDALGIGLIDFVYRPVITPRMVEHLCGLREARRLVALDLTNNDLDNDAVRALARSTNFIRLTDLAVQQGNPRVKGRVWSELLERFGSEVVR